MDKTKAVCRYCTAEVKYNGKSTYNLTTHYNNHHMGQKSSASEQPSIREAFGFPKKYTRSSQRIMLVRKVAEYLIANLRPIDTVESEAFKNLCTSLDSKFDFPGKTYFLNTVIPNMYKETKNKLKNILKDPTGIAITADGLTSIATESYMTLTGHFITEDQSLMNV